MIARAFWALDIAFLSLLAGGLLLAPGRLLASATFDLILAACVVLWIIHSAQVHAHRDESLHDRDLHRSRERRGF